MFSELVITIFRTSFGGNKLQLILSSTHLSNWNGRWCRVQCMVGHVLCAMSSTLFLNLKMSAYISKLNVQGFQCHQLSVILSTKTAHYVAWYRKKSNSLLLSCKHSTFWKTSRPLWISMRTDNFLTIYWRNNKRMLIYFFLKQKTSNKTFQAKLPTVFVEVQKKV